MHRSGPERVGTNINGKSSSQQAGNGLTPESSVPHASVYYAILLRMVLPRRTTSRPRSDQPGILDLDLPMSWIDTSEMEFHEEFIGESFGRINKPEANLLLQELEAYIRKIGEKRVLEERIDFGLISPYKAQVQYLRGKLKGCSFFRPFRSQITIHTVDGFQGQERDVIFISLVRANEDGQIGFLNDLRRMNVAITRARMKLVILGDAVTMSKHAFYKKLIGYIRHISQGL